MSLANKSMSVKVVLTQADMYAGILAHFGVFVLAVCQKASGRRPRGPEPAFPVTPSTGVILTEQPVEAAAEDVLLAHLVRTDRVESCLLLVEHSMLPATAARDLCLRVDPVLVTDSTARSDSLA